MKRTQRMTKREDVQLQMKYNKELVQISTINKENIRKEDNRKGEEWGLTSRMKKIEMKTQIITTPSLTLNDSQPIQTIRNWDYTLNKNKILAKVMPSNIYYPPNCSGYDITYCKAQKTIYIYGGISCSSSLVDGIKPYFYKFFQGKWLEVKPESTYNPIPRYGHTLTAFQKQLVLFGGVSEYKQKLKDRCFYTDCAAYSTTKNNWRVIQTSGMSMKTRKSHSAGVYGRHYLVYGGLNESEQLINQISWMNMECKKGRWKCFPIQGRFNHKMAIIEPQSGKDFICIFGGRNNSSQIISSMFFVPISVFEGDLQIREAVQIHHAIMPREMPIMGQFLEGFMILGGIDKNNEVVEDCWYCNNDKQTFTKIKLDIEYDDLRGAKACSLSGQSIYLMTGNSLNYKAIQFIASK